MALYGKSTPSDYNVIATLIRSERQCFLFKKSFPFMILRPQADKKITGAYATVDNDIHSCFLFLSMPLHDT